MIWSFPIFILYLTVNDLWVCATTRLFSRKRQKWPCCVTSLSHFSRNDYCSHFQFFRRNLFWFFAGNSLSTRFLITFPLWFHPSFFFSNLTSFSFLLLVFVSLYLYLKAFRLKNKRDQFGFLIPPKTRYQCVRFKLIHSRILT